MTFAVRTVKCPTCIFRPGNPMSLEEGRLAEMVEEASGADSYITCHETLEMWTGERDTEAMCRGYLDTGRYPQMLRIAERLGAVVEV